MNNQTQYIVTGAAGFLGSTVCRHLLNQGKKVRALVLPNDPADKFLSNDIEIVKGNLCDVASLKALFDVPAEKNIAVIHCASIVTMNPDHSPKVMEVNVDGTKNIIDCCLSHKGRHKLVYVSSTGAIPEAPKGKLICEPLAYDPEQVVGCYSRSKAIASQLVLDAIKERGLNACIVLPSGILGPSDFAVGHTTKVVIEIVKGEMRMGINGSFNLCDVRDLADGCIAAVQKGRVGESYILANDEVFFPQFSKLVAEVSGCKPIRRFLPCPIANFIARIMESRAKKKGKTPLMTTFSVYNLARNNAFDSSKARRELGYCTRSYTETMRDEIEWLRSEKLI